MQHVLYSVHTRCVCKSVFLVCARIQTAYVASEFSASMALTESQFKCSWMWLLSLPESVKAELIDLLKEVDSADLQVRVWPGRSFCHEGLDASPLVPNVGLAEEARQLKAKARQSYCHWSTTCTKPFVDTSDVWFCRFVTHSRGSLQPPNPDLELHAGQKDF